MLKKVKKYTFLKSRVADPERFDADPDPDPDPTFQADADPAEVREQC